ncbi:hypothetical protein ACR79P_14675 [Sphingobacterium spiritivorum]|uniref:hypothetical protein n=1 Tax=Sphingobacterium spiritivorum TaxID=258 RepID=UPI003DA66DE3
MKIVIFNGVIKMVLLMLPIMFFGLTIDTTKKIELPGCKPTLPNPKVFCGEVGAKGRYKGSDGNFDYSYQKIMYESACADIDNMNEREINQKLREWWNLFKDKLVCDCVQFNVPNGSVFKFAIRSYLTSFIDDAIYAKFDLNFIDKADGRTILDYTRDELNKQTHTSPVRKLLQEYYDKLRAAGAKHRSELEL